MKGEKKLMINPVEIPWANTGRAGRIEKTIAVSIITKAKKLKTAIKVGEAELNIRAKTVFKTTKRSPFKITVATLM
ncbi:MAG TPA: hypothetical protein PLB18_05915 [Acidobacteriota bacterium]|nr:hypothetical protein [Acidobacteriota bacterium]HND18886.1 hypothetical protein [Acidobacteriota bacterium]HNH83673.1 hypothetical protein [Acidobacteriota bacterium]